MANFTDTNVIKEMFLKLKDDVQIRIWNEYTEHSEYGDYEEYRIYPNDESFFEMLAHENINLDFVMEVVIMVKNNNEHYDYNHKYVSYSTDACDGSVLLFSSNNPVDLMYQDSNGLDSGFLEYLVDKYFA